MFRFGRRQLTPLAALLLFAGCLEPHEVAGHAPERTTRELPHDGPPVPKDRMALYKKKQDAAAVAAASPRVEKLDVTQARIGVASTHEFHAAGCKALTDVPAADLVRFTSPWDALDAGYGPCDRCKSR